MISMFEYSATEVDLLYSIIEEAVKEDKPVDLDRVAHLLHQGDFYLCGCGSGGLDFTFNGLKWVDNDGEIWTCIIQPKLRHGQISPQWYPKITINDRNKAISWGNLSMIKKENRYFATEPNWYMYRMDDSK